MGWIFLSAPEQIHVVLNTTFNFGDIAGDAERRPGSVAERDGGGPNRGLSAPALPRPDTALSGKLHLRGVHLRGVRLSFKLT